MRIWLLYVSFSVDTAPFVGGVSILFDTPVASACLLIHCLYPQGSASASFILCVVLH